MQRPRLDPHLVADRLATWSEQARAAGREERADALLFEAFEAYGRPVPQWGRGNETGQTRYQPPILTVQPEMLRHIA